MEHAIARQRFSKTESDLFDWMLNTRSERVHFVRGFAYQKKAQIDWDRFASRWAENCGVLVAKSLKDSAIPADVFLRNATQLKRKREANVKKNAL